MKLEAVTKLDKRNKATSKKFDDYVISAHIDVIIIFSNYGQFGRNSDYRRKKNFPKNPDILQKNADISNIKRALVLQGMFFKTETMYVSVPTSQISSI